MGDVGFDGGEVAKLSRSSKLARALFSFKLDQKRIIIIKKVIENALT